MAIFLLLYLITYKRSLSWLILSTNAAHIHARILGARPPQPSRGRGVCARVALDLAGADIDLGGVGGLPIRRDRRLVGKRQVCLDVGDLLLVGLSDCDNMLAHLACLEGWGSC